MTALLAQLLCGLYRLALRAYPADFRGQYGHDMAQLFADHCRSIAASQGIVGLARFSASAATDWFSSVARERASSLTAAEPIPNGVPLFYLYGDDRPSTGALLNGGAASVFVFMLISVLIGIGVNHRRVFIIGSHHPSPSHMLAASSTAEPVDLASEVHVKPYHDQTPVEPYFKLLPVLRALDTDQDNIISAAEMASAPSALRKLDKNHDGSISAEECGLRFRRFEALAPREMKAAGLRFMRFHPVHAALDTDGDGSISPHEIKTAARSLANLDRNRDGALTLDELLPER